jgi:hypothetical protein
MRRYTHRQTSAKALVLPPIAAAVSIPVLLSLNGGTRAPLLVPIAILVAVVALVTVIVAVFSTMITEVTDSEVVVGFRFGAMQRRVPFADIVRAERANIAWWHGTGVKYGLNTTSYLVRPGPAVALILKSGRTLRIGTDDPDGLMAALKR